MNTAAVHSEHYDQAAYQTNKTYRIQLCYSTSLLPDSPAVDDLTLAVSVSHFHTINACSTSEFASRSLLFQETVPACQAVC